MARIFSDGSGGTGGSETSEQVLSINASGTVTLPDGIDATSLELSRDGQDLVLISPDGQTFIIENYFLAADAPVIMSEGGALLTPALVQSFLTSGGDVQLAATEQASDASPVGHVTEVSGEATVTHADGTKEKISIGSKIYEGDIVETDAEGAVNITFADESTFAVSENARLAIDDFSFNPSDQSGSTGLSILRGVFMFTSGLIGRENPDAVQLETPVGSIGIRGTIIGGHIQEGGQSQISVIEGAIVVRNGAGEQILSGQFETVQLTSFSAPMTNIGQLDSGQMTQSYGAVRSVSPTLFTSIDDTGRDAGQNRGNNTSPQNQNDASSNGNDQPQQQQGEQQPQQQQAPQGGEQPQQQDVKQQPVTDKPVFQELNTGSNLDSGPTPPPATQSPPPPAPTPVNTAPQTPPPPPLANQPQDTAPEVLNRAPVFGNSTINVSEGTPIVLTPGMIAASDPEGLNGSLTYQVLGAQKGVVQKFDGTSWNAASNFTQQDLATGKVRYVHDGSEPGSGVANISLTARDAGGNLSAPKVVPVTVTNVNDAPVLSVSTGPTIPEDSATVLTPTMLRYTDSDHTPAQVTYTLTGMNHGTVQKYNGTTWVSLVATDTFTQADIGASKIRFVQNGDENTTADFSYTVTDGVASPQSNTLSFTVSGVNDAPVEVNNTAATLDEESSIVLTSGNLTYTDTEQSAAQLTYTVTSETNGIVEYSADGATGWTQVSTFTQADIDAGKVRFTHDGTETTDASFDYELSDGVMATPISGTFDLTVNTLNDAPIDITSDSYNVDLDENTTDSVVLATLNVNDEEGGFSAGDFAVLGDVNNRFEVAYDGGEWVLRSKAGQSFDHETESSIVLQVRLTDGSNTPVLTSDITVNINDVNEAAQNLTLNNSHVYNGTHDALIQGNVDGARIARLSHDDPDDSAGFRPDETRYNISSVSSNTAGLTVDDFIVVDVTTETGEIEQILKLKDGVSANFSGTGESITVTIDLDADQDVGFGGLNDLSRTYTFLGRNDTMVLETVNGNNGFQIFNNSRFPGPGGGARFGANLSVADLDNDGRPDLIIGAPGAQNGSAQQSGGIYAFRNSGLYTNADDGEVTLSSLTQGSAGQGFFVEGSAPDQYYGSSVAILGRFNSTPQAEIAITNPGAGTVEIRNADTSLVMSINNIPTGGVTGEALAKAINVTSIGDVNGDGYNDLVIGAPGANGDQGKLALVKGNFTVSTQDFSTLNHLSPYATGDRFAEKVAGLGDVNGDGFDDFVTGSYLYDTNSTAAGDAQGAFRVYFGSQTFNASAPAYAEVKSTVDNSHLSSNLSAAGDFNGDGLADMLVRTGNADSGRGSVSLIFGNENFHTLSNLDIANLNTQTYFNGATFHWSQADGGIRVGDAMSTAGDFNGDGYSDIAINVSKALGGDQYEHMIYVVYGSATPMQNYNLDALANDPAKAFKIRLLEPAGKDISLASAGDMNGDGFDDLVIGNASDGPNDDGSVSVVYGANYNNAVQTFASSANVGAGGQSFVGSTGNDVLNGVGHAGISFRGGAGDDALHISDDTAIQHYDGGIGKDTLKLFFSGDESGTAAQDFIDLRGISQKMTNVEVIQFNADSRMDTLKLDIRDVLSLGADSDALTAGKKTLMILGTNTTGGEENTLALYDGNTLISDISTGVATHLRFTKDADSNTVQDTRTVGSDTFYVYTHQNSGVELLVDARLAGAANLAGV